MKKRFLCFLLIALLGYASVGIYAQETDSTITLDFRNQEITDILLSLAEISGESIVFDDTVTGFATFFFAEVDFETALQRFADYARLYVEKRTGMYFVSRIFIEHNETTDLLTINAEEVNPESLIEALSRNTDKTIFYDSLPMQAITVRVQDVSLEQVLRLVMTKYPEYQLRSENGGFYIANISSSSNASNRAVSLNLENNEGVFSLATSRTNLPDIIKLLFSRAEKEYSLLNKSSALLENLYFENKNFDEMLALILEQANSDYRIENDVYYIFEIQKNDVLKNLKTTIMIPMEHISVENAMTLFPSELNAPSFTRINKITNALYITGSDQQIQPIVAFIKQIDVPLEGRYYKEFSVHNISVDDAVNLIPESLLFSQPIPVPGTTSFIAQVTNQREQELQDYLKLVDIKISSVPIHLSYIQSEELLKFLPPSVNTEQITITGDPSLVFFTGSEAKYAEFIEDLVLIDQPKKQIRYQILVIQYQKTDSFNWSSGISIEKTDSTPAALISGTMSNLLNVKFDIVSQLGFQFAANLNAELGESRAAILADTTLNGISGESIHFENTNTFRYRDVAIDAETGLYTGTTREISSGLVIEVEGWVSGDEMITVNIDARVSKQGAVPDSSSSTASTNPPPTSEKSVTTNVRTRSGEPVIIGGLLQTEQDTTIKEPPLFGFLFKNQTETDATTEMVIYLVPFVEKHEQTARDYNNTIRNYYSKYIEE